MAGKSALLLQSLHDRGFDESYRVRGGLLKVKCSQCRAATINGVACHEAGCPNQTRSCDECGQPIPTQQRLCEDCAAVEYELVLDE